MRDVKPRSTMYELTCDALPGFILRVLPTGKKVFLVRFRVDGKDRRERIGLWGPALTVDDARRRAALMLSNAAVGEPVNDEPGRKAAGTPARSEQAPSKITTLRDLSGRFLREYVDVYTKPGSAENYRRYLLEEILPWRPRTDDGKIDETQPQLGDRDYRSITRADAMALHGSLKSTPAKANYVLCVLGSFYTRIIEDWELANIRNPTGRLRRFTLKKRKRFLTPAERRAVHDVMVAGVRTPVGRKGHLDPSSVWAINLLAMTGLRRDEICDLMWPNIDWQHSNFDLYDSKTGPRSVPVSAQVMTLLRTIHDHRGNPREGRVVTSRTGGKLSSINRTWTQIREAAGIPDVRIHDLRHSFASDALMSGVPLAVVGEMLGHRQPSTTQRYAHLADSVVRQAVEITNLRISDAINTIPAIAEAPFVPLSDAQWTVIRPIVEHTRGSGGAASDLRKIVDGIRWVLQRDVRWRDLPAQYGRPTTCWRWYERWLNDGTWSQVEAKLGLAPVTPKRRSVPKTVSPTSRTTTTAA
ncbi:MAG: tyrosine-type recombinase/integrase [Myxococcales bacterium]|nr:tyrosine-type recombinase/integrase [Myxococcales bacterium]